MPYVSKTEQVSAHWVSIPEAIQRIYSADNCDPENAENQLRTALKDGALRPLKWQDEETPPIFASTMTIAADTPPQKGPDWGTADIDWNSGTVLDLWGDYKFKKRRILLLPTLRVTQIWPLAARQTSSAEAQAVKILTERLQGLPNLKRDDAREILKQKNISVSARGFQGRVWPQARTNAGLNPTASAGRKKVR
ncbi:MAG: hypothetical protein JO256_03915 [Alphaproteobacteria bacterium]|nr:hypothetical protein [Alphaproteobacteria bacterium]